MMKQFARILLLALLVIQALPLFAFAQEEQAATLTGGHIREPYEKVMAQTGKWYSEQIPLEGNSKLVLQYQGEYKAGFVTGPMEFKLDEKIILRGIYLPYAAISTEPITIQLADEKGNTLPPLTAQPAILDEAAQKMNFVCFPLGDIGLPEGTYQMTLSNGEGAVGAFAVKGVSYEAYERYKGELPPLGNQEFAGADPDRYQQQEFETPPEKKPAVFSLDQEYQIDEIIVNTYMDGAGAAPGTISVIAEDGTVLFTQQAAGGKLGDTANGIWTIAPGTVLPAGGYYLGMSDPSVMSFDKSGEPMFYVKASAPAPVRYDFTGTYRINFDAIKTSTIMGPVSDGSSSFSLQDFELTVLYKEGAVELIGKYQGIPFSQECQITEEMENTVTAEFSAVMDLTKLPYKANISGNGAVVLSRAENGDAQISIQGTGRFQRAASKDLGADDNTYSLVSSGVMVSNDLPPFVVTALGTVGGVGNIPGPDNAAQAAAGMLFPPLIGLVANVLQDLMKPKPKAAPVVRDKGWYKMKYPDLSDEQLAMVMLADAMGSTDEPDAEDAESEPGSGAESGSDQETQPEDEEYGGDADDTVDADDADNTDDVDDADNTDDADDAGQEQGSPDKEQEYPPDNDENGKQPEKASEAQDEQPPPQASEAEQSPKEPEEMILKTSANGAESRYVKNPETGEWVNAETGNILDYEKYKSTVAPQLEADKKYNDEQFGINSRGETAHDKALRDEMQKIADAEKTEAYKNALKSKYGTDDMSEIKKIADEKQQRDQASFERWKKIADFNDAGDKVATTVGVISDVAVDGLSTITPGGDYIKATYKVSKSIAGIMAEKGTSWGSLTEGAIKGAADAGNDFIKIKNPYLNTLAKASATMAAETGGSAAGAAMRGEDWVKAGAEGAVDGAFKVVVGAATDSAAGDFPTVSIPKDSIKVLPTMKNVLVNKPAAVKTASGLVDEFVTKPKVVQPIKDAMKPVFEKKK